MKFRFLYVTVLKDNLYGELNDKQSLYVNTIISSSNHLLELINDILEIIKLDRGVTKLFPKPIDLIQLFHEVSNLAFPFLNAKAQKFSVKVEDNVPVVTWDKQKIEQVIMNLLSNAVKFTPDGGEISIDAGMSGDYIEIKVSDTGIGVPEDMREKVFLAFEQANSSYTKLYQGVGLGLAICKSLVELHCGIIWLEENPGGGTVACVLLPPEPFNKDGNRAKSIVIPRDINNVC